MWVNWIDIGASSIASLTHSSGFTAELNVIYCPGKGGDWMWWVEVNNERLGKPAAAATRKDSKARCVAVLEHALAAESEVSGE